MMQSHSLTRVMNDTKWNEIRLAMYGLSPSPAWRAFDLSGYQSAIDREWYYHFQAGGYTSMQYVDILVDDAAQRSHVLQALRTVHVPSEETAEGFRVFGYLQGGQTADYL
ncbi:MAG: DUF6678 family protein [Pseudomonadota bacterium]|jgi:hypothetical protein|uniref:DUF6678 family protein n=1 Tax=Sphingobium yanoikuyae TaxID=13690 RepID=UPI003013474A